MYLYVQKSESLKVNFKFTKFEVAITAVVFVCQRFRPRTGGRGVIMRVVNCGVQGVDI